jgi:hypothetical protein
LAPVTAAWALGAACAAFAQEPPIQVTLQVLDDVSDIEGVLMPLEEEPAHGPDTESDSAPAPDDSSPANPVDEEGVR